MQGRLIAGITVGLATQGVDHQLPVRRCGHASSCCCAGAHNCIVTSRAGKDLVSCLVSGLLTIGPRFGGAIDDAARFFQA